ncbi:sensor domain-containing diguanylate cyclase [Calidithermus timidus]|jgi:diguanylate cyclase (GGDEF)-like protein|uniref:sensor domain-containing diguanylate cyclase n=1 Tax=Calidithermus timidus TaxID=307124 RepID=UPI00036C29FC|nr:sensor domain-containing diguanylate cyclase [Calidithermus timidus]
MTGLEGLLDLPQTVVWLDPQGRIGWHNRAAASALSRLGLEGQPILSLLEQGSRLRLVEAQPPVTLPYQGHCTLVIEGKPRRWYRFFCHPYLGGTLCFGVDVSDLYSKALAYQTTLEVLSNLLTRDARLEELLQHVLETAVAVVPGAQAGSIWYYSGEQFRLAAQVGFSQELMDIAVPYEDELKWYGSGEEAWRQGQPRLLQGAQIVARSFLILREGPGYELGKIDKIQANLCVPVVLGGEAMAVLNLDNLEHPDAFPPEAVAIASHFALQTAVLLYGVLNQRNLSELAHTDPLTGLGNRRALSEGFARMRTQAQRLGKPLTMIFWDLDGLKRVNDQHGHVAGDQVLREVALALQTLLRHGDRAYRIGGDEFVSLHLDLSEGEEGPLIERVRSALPLRISAGAARASETMSLEQVLELADTQMYRDKPLK